MDNYWICIVLAVVYGIVAGGVYTWMSPRRRGSWRMMVRSTLAYTAVGAVLAWIFYIIFK